MNNELAQERGVIIEKVIGVEGGYVDDPSDSGGKTKYGITEAVARKHGWDKPISELPYKFAFAVFLMDYWKPLNLNRILKHSSLIATELFDTGVNQGVVTAAEYLQRSLNVLNNKATLYDDLVVDGRIGVKTLCALDAYLTKRDNEGERVLFSMLNCLQGEGYVTLAERREKDEKFIYGWFRNRVS